MPFDVTTTKNNWTVANLTAIAGLQEITIDQARVAAKDNGVWVHLEGLKYAGCEAHLTITPGPRKNETGWNYVHFTVTIKNAPCHAYYEFTDKKKLEGATKVIDKDIDSKKLVNPKEHNGHKMLDDSKFRNEILMILTQIT